MKKMICFILIMLLACSSIVFAKGDELKKKGDYDVVVHSKASKETHEKHTLVYLDAVTGERVEFEDSSPTLTKALEKWLEIAFNTFSYHDGTVKFLSIKESKKTLIIDFSEDYYSIEPSSVEFGMFMWSLKETVFTNTEIQKILIKIEGNDLEHIGEYDYTGGITRASIEDVDLDVSIKSIPDIPNPVIVIDPGHGGIWNNATAIDGTLEKDIVLAVGKYLRTDLQNRGATVIMTRDTDTYFSTNLTADLQARVDIANNNDADLFISLHCNGGSPSSNGTEAFWPEYHHVTTSTRLANDITSKISSRHGINQRTNRVGDFQVLRDTNMPAVLVELAFITNSADYSELDSAADRDAMAYSIYLGIRKFWWGY